MNAEDFLAQFKKMSAADRADLINKMDDYEDEAGDEEDEDEDDDEAEKSLYDVNDLNKALDEVDSLTDEPAPVDAPTVGGGGSLAKSFAEEGASDALDGLTDELNKGFNDLNTGIDDTATQINQLAKAVVATGHLAKAIAEGSESSNARLDAIEDALDEIREGLSGLSKSVNAPQPLKGRGKGAQPRARKRFPSEGDQMRKSRGPRKDAVLAALTPIAAGEGAKAAKAVQAMEALDRGDSSLAKSLVPEIFKG